MSFGSLLGDLAGKVLGGNEEGGEGSNLLGMAEQGLGALGVTKEAALGKAAGVVSSATGFDAQGMLGKFGLGGDEQRTEEANEEANLEATDEANLEAVSDENLEHQDEVEADGESPEDEQA